MGVAFRSFHFHDELVRTYWWSSRRYTSWLILPEDCVPGTAFGLIRIRLPKTMGPCSQTSSSSSWPSKPVDLFGSGVRKVRQGQTSVAVFFEHSEEEAESAAAGTWPGDSQDCKNHYLHMFEDTEFVRRRGRWMSDRSMEIYLQEATATFQQHLTSAAKSKIERLCLHFPRILLQSQWFLEHQIPPATWPHLWHSAPAWRDGRNGNRWFKSCHCLANASNGAERAEFHASCFVQFSGVKRGIWFRLKHFGVIWSHGFLV